MLPSDIPPSVLSNLYISATPFPNVLRGPQLLSDFQSRKELIDACMASVHIPLFMNKRVIARYRGKRYIDGSFWNFVNKRAYQDPVPPSVLERLAFTRPSLQVNSQSEMQRGSNDDRLLQTTPDRSTQRTTISTNTLLGDAISDNSDGAGAGAQGDGRRDSLFNLSVDDVFIVDWHSDEKFRRRSKESLVSLITPDGLYEMMQYGYDYMKQQHRRGQIPEVF
jgi:predicted acylesterase/phospholipase RssA